MEEFDLAVIGEGISGLTAAAHAAQLGLSVASFEGRMFGGLILNITALSDSSPPMSGAELVASIAETCNSAGVARKNGHVQSLQPVGSNFEVATAGEKLRAQAVILATGASLRRLGIPGESQLRDRGVSQCADCDGPIFSGMSVVVVGGGDAAFMQAHLLAKYVSEVHVVFRSGQPRARPEFVAAVANNSRINMLSDTTVLEVLGDEEVTGVHIRRHGVEFPLDCGGVFVYAGTTPNSSLVRSFARLSEAGAVETDTGLQTNVRGLYAVGAVREGYSGKAVDAVSEARRAASLAAMTMGKSGAF